MDRRDDLHDLLLRALAPLVMEPFAGASTDLVRLAGVVRAGVNRTRTVVLASAPAPARIAVDFTLVDDGVELDVDAAVDWLRTLPAADVKAARGVTDSHGNVIVAAGMLGFTPQHRPTRSDISYFSVLRQLLYGGGILWFEDICTLEGYLLSGPGRHRLYVKDTTTGAVTGIDLPLTAADGSISPGQAGTFPTVLPTLVRDDQLRYQPRLADDDYSSAVYDLSSWINGAPDPEPDAG